MNKRKRITLFLRRLGVVAACAVAVAALCLGDFAGLGHRAALMAVSLRQPAAALSLLDEHLFPAVHTVAPPAAMSPEALPNRGDSTRVELPASAPVATPAITMVSPPGNQGDGGKILEKTMDPGNPHKAGIATVNRSGTAVDVAAALKRDLTLQWEDTDQPQVLILHTHTTEGYMTYAADYYNAADRQRTRDHTRSVVAVGEAVRLALAAEGITALHDTTLHDSPVYSGAYNRSAATARQYLEQYPTIRVVLDLHRDAVTEGGAMVRPTATVDGKKAAQLMLVTGVVSTDALPHPQWEQNLTLAARLHQALSEVSPQLMRPLNTVASRYNQHLSPGWLLVEVGAEGNTVEEAVYAAQLLAKALATLPD